MTADPRRDKICQAMIYLPGWLLNLLTQKIKRCELLGSRLVGVKIDIVADAVCRPETEHASRGQ